MGPASFPRHRRARAVRRGLASLCLVATASLIPGAAPAVRAGAGSSEPPTEYEVKAAYLYHFIRFAEWPDGAFAENATGVFVVAVLGDDPFGGTLEETFQGKQVFGRKISVLRTLSPEQAAKAQLVFVCARMTDSLPQLLQAAAGHSVLVVGDTPESALKGATIGFRLEEHRVRFDIDPRRAEEKGLRLSSQLLRVARIVGPERPKN